MLHRLHAGLLLALSLIKTLFIRYVLPAGETGLVSFQRKFRADRLLPLAPEDRKLLPRASSCIGCGRCVSAVSGRGNADPLSFVLAGARSMPEFDAAASLVSDLGPEDLDAMRERCPVDMPFAELVDFVRRYANQLEQAGRDS